MAVEKILGSNTSGSGTFTANPDFQYSEPSLVAGWSGSASSVNCTTGKIQFGTWDGPANYRMLVWNNSGTLIGTSDVLNMTADDTFKTFTFSTPVTIVKGTTYRLGWQSEGPSNNRPWGNGTGGSIHADNTTSFAGGAANWTESATPEATKHLSAYLEADTAGGAASTVICPLM